MKITLSVNGRTVVVYSESPDSALAALLRGMIDEYGFVTLPAALTEDL